MRFLTRPLLLAVLCALLIVLGACESFLTKKEGVSRTDIMVVDGCMVHIQGLEVGAVDHEMVNWAFSEGCSLDVKNPATQKLIKQKILEATKKETSDE